MDGAPSEDKVLRHLLLDEKQIRRYVWRTKKRRAGLAHQACDRCQDDQSQTLHRIPPNVEVHRKALALIMLQRHAMLCIDSLIQAAVVWADARLSFASCL